MVIINTYSAVLVIIPDMYILSILVHIQIHMFHLHDDRNQTYSDSSGNIQVPRCRSYKLLDTNKLIMSVLMIYYKVSYMCSFSIFIFH